MGWSKTGDFKQGPKLNSTYPVGDKKRDGICTALSALWIARRMTHPGESVANRMAWLSSDSVFMFAGALQKYYSNATPAVTVSQNQQNPMSEYEANEAGKDAVLEHLGLKGIGGLAFKHLNSESTNSRKAAIGFVNTIVNHPYQYSMVNFSLKKGGHATAIFRDNGFWYPEAFFFDCNAGEFRIDADSLADFWENYVFAYWNIVNFRIRPVQAVAGGAKTLV